MTRGVPPGAPPSPILFNIYIDVLATTSGASDFVRGSNGAIVIVSDDALLQASTQRHLQCHLNFASERQSSRRAIGPLGSSHIYRTKNKKE